MATLNELLAARRIVLKYGTNVLTSTDEAGNVLGLDGKKIGGLSRIVNTLYDAGREPVIVSSAAVSAGMANSLNRLSVRPTDVDDLQDLASEGQAELVMAYKGALLPYGIGVVQLLVTHHNFATEAERANIQRRVDRSFERRKLIVANTNDAVVTYELVRGIENGFTDNDPLSALFAVCCKKGATSLIIVSESGHFGSGGSKSKKDAFLYAERNGVMTNRNNHVTHSILEEAVNNYFKLSGLRH